MALSTGQEKTKTQKINKQKNQETHGVSDHLPSLQFPPLVSYWNVINTPEGRFLNINLIQIMKKKCLKQTSYASKSNMNT